MAAGSYSIDRVKRPEPIHVKHFAVGVVGGIQPERLTDLLRTADDGLAARFLWTWPDKLPPVQCPRQHADLHFAVAALGRLVDLAMVQGEDGESRPFFCTVASGARDLLQEFRERDHRCNRDSLGPLKKLDGQGTGPRFAACPGA